MYHDVEWTAEAIKKFWGFQTVQASLRQDYFSRTHAPAILNLVLSKVSLEGPVVDLGCGPGDLIEELLTRGIPCLGMDPSAESVAEVNQRLTGRPGFLGVRQGFLDAVPLADGETGAAFLIEVVEHLTDNYLGRALSELQRILRPGGIVVVTVPNSEDLEANKVACPECGCAFHRMQHVRSLSQESLSEILHSAGFVPVHVQPTNLRHHRGGALRRLHGSWREWTGRIRGKRMPHLVAIAPARTNPLLTVLCAE